MSVLLGMISDIHGNDVALDAVIADAREQGVHAWWVLGDLVAIGPEPVATLERLAELPGVRFVRGNTDRYVVTGDRPPPTLEDVARDPSLQARFEEVDASFRWTRTALETAGWLQWLADLPTERRAVLADGARVLGVHASPGRDDGAGITPATGDADLEEMLQAADADVVLAGHTHRATNRAVRTGRAVNLGSVSNPITEDLRASNVIVDDDPRGHRIAHRRVAYNHDAVLARIRRSSHPAADYLASFQRGEQIRY